MIGSDVILNLASNTLHLQGKGLKVYFLCM